MPLAWTITAATQRPDRLFSDVVPILLLLVATVVVGGVLIYVVRRSMHGGAADSPDGFTLHDLRTLHARGDLTDDEFERAKAAMIGRLARTESPEEPAARAPGTTGNRDPGIE